MIKKFAGVIWHQSPEVVRIQASLSELMQPTIGEYAQGKQATYGLLYAYDLVWRRRRHQTENSEPVFENVATARAIFVRGGIRPSGLQYSESASEFWLSYTRCH